MCLWQEHYLGHAAANTVIHGSVTYGEFWDSHVHDLEFVHVGRLARLHRIAGRVAVPTEGGAQRHKQTVQLR